MTRSRDFYTLQYARSSRRGAFTLLEVMMAVLITALLMGALFRFVQSNLQAIKISTELSTERKALEGLINLVRDQLNDLPARGQAMLLGTTNKYRDLASDEMQWVSKAGAGILTTAAPDEYRVTLAIQPIEKTSKELEIGLRRRRVDAQDESYSWLPLLRNVVAMEIRYFDPRQNAWVERWRDPAARPAVVRLRIWRRADTPPVEAVLPVPSSQVRS